MKNTAILAIMAVLAGGAHAAGLDSLNVKASDLKAASYGAEMDIPAPAAVPAANVAGERKAAAGHSVKTVISCERDDADAWVEIGIAENDGPGFRAYVIFHNVDLDASELVADRQVVARAEGRETVYEDAAGTLKLRVSRGAQGLPTGDFSMIYDGPHGPVRINEKELPCAEKSVISFD